MTQRRITINNSRSLRHYPCHQNKHNSHSFIVWYYQLQHQQHDFRLRVNRRNKKDNKKKDIHMAFSNCIRLIVQLAIEIVSIAPVRSFVKHNQHQHVVEYHSIKPTAVCQHIENDNPLCASTHTHTLSLHAAQALLTLAP